MCLMGSSPLWIKLWIVDRLVDNSGDDVNNFLFVEVNTKSLLDLVETREKLVSSFDR